MRLIKEISKKKEDDLDKAVRESFAAGIEHPVIDVRPTQQTKEEHREKAKELDLEQKLNRDKAASRKTIW
ncbi:hypothetical protein KJ654_03155 [Patescibacteria group bacterium]|nr:hypothetical protein [Patescibacteria group bacterium]MBU1966699.1 hypothetical protein [Patescibacteria group bacterium]